MKTKITIIGLAVFLAGMTLKAQTNSTPANPNAEINFVQTAGSWLTSIDYTKSWPTNEIDLSVGGLWQNNVNWANYIGVQKNFGNIITYGQMDNQGVAGTIDRVQFGLGYRLLNRGDLSAQITLEPGYDRTTSGIYVEPNITLRKLMAHGSFIEMSLNYDFVTKGQQPSFPGLRIGTGFPF